MSFPPTTTIENLTRCKSLPGFFPGGFCDPFIRRIAFEDVSGYGPEVSINRATLGAAAAYSAGGAMALAASSTALMTFPFQRIGDTVEVDSADVVSSEDAQQQLEIQIAMKRVALVRELTRQIIEGSGIAPDLIGLTEAVASGQKITPTAGAPGVPTLDDYHRLLTKVCASDGLTGVGPDALLMHPRTRRQLISILETNGGGADFEMDDHIDHKVLTFEGLPVYFSEAVAVNEDAAGEPNSGTLTSVYALKLDGPTGVRVLHQGGDSSDFGIIVEQVPQQLSTSTMAATVRGFYTLLVPEEQSVARMHGVDISTFTD